MGLQRFYKSKLTVLLLILNGLFLCGCGALDVDVLIDKEKGDAAFEQMSQSFHEVGENIESGIENTKDGVTSGAKNITDYAIPSMWYRMCVLVKRWVPALIVCSIGLAFILTELFKKNMEIRKFALVNLGVKLPIIAFVAVYVLAFLYGTLGGNLQAVADRYQDVTYLGIPEIWYLWTKGLGIIPWLLVALSFGIGVAISATEMVRQNKEMQDFIYQVPLLKIPVAIGLVCIVYPTLFYMLN